jgi:hypothetical protein
MRSKRGEERDMRSKLGEPFDAVTGCIVRIHTHRLNVVAVKCLKIVFCQLPTNVFKKYYNLWPLEFIIIIFKLSCKFYPQTDRKRGKGWFG